MPATTNAAFDWLTLAVATLPAPTYMMLLTLADAIRRSRHSARLGVAHLDAALTRMGAGDDRAA